MYKLCTYFYYTCCSYSGEIHKCLISLDKNNYLWNPYLNKYV